MISRRFYLPRQRQHVLLISEESVVAVLQCCGDLVRSEVQDHGVFGHLEDAQREVRMQALCIDQQVLSLP